MKKAMEKLCQIFSENTNFSPKLMRGTAIKTLKTIKVCNNCNIVKEGSLCQVCPDGITLDCTMLILNTKDQIIRILEANHMNLAKTNLGYCEKSIFNKIHKKMSNAITLTLNTDGLSVFHKGNIDAWPIFLTINELPNKSKFEIRNVILAGLWMGPTKINNYEVLNMVCNNISELERGVEIHSYFYKVYVIYGIFDKPARALMLGMKSSNATYGCSFCLSKSKHKPGSVYHEFPRSIDLRSDSFSLANGIKSAENGGDYFGHKIPSPLR